MNVQTHISKLRWTYVVALSCVASLTIGGHFVLRSIIAEMKTDAAVVNAAGHQRMLSQRIAAKSAALALAAHTGDRHRIVVLRHELAEAVRRWTESHDDLQAIGRERRVAGTDPASVSERLDALERDHIEPAAGLVADLISMGATDAAGGPDAAEAEIFATMVAMHADGYLPRMHETVGMYEQAANARVHRLERAETILAFITLLVLVCEACLVFEPAVRRLRRTTTELAEAKRAAEVAMATKSEFLANISHEVRTPMTAILGYAEVLSDRCADLGEDAEEAIATIMRNGEHLLVIVNDVLDMSKAESGQMQLELVTSNLAELVCDADSLVRGRADAKGLRLAVRYDTPVPETVETDPVRLRQILFNLLGNAVKFTESGSVTLSVSHDRGAGVLRFSVADTGIGLSPEKLERLSRFEAFTQADASTTRRFGGTGLGLRLTNALSKMLGGGLEIESKEGAGSTFTAHVRCDAPAGVRSITPVCEDGVPVRSPIGTPSPDGEAARRTDVRVLLAEDGVDNQRLITHHLRKADIDVIVACDGLEAIEMMDRLPADALPDLIFMDMQMPRLDGYSATRRLREAGCTIPIIALTAHAMEGDRERCLEAGCSDYLSKPVDRVTLLRTCARWVEAEPWAPSRRDAA